MMQYSPTGTPGQTPLAMADAEELAAGYMVAAVELVARALKAGWAVQVAAVEHGYELDQEEGLIRLDGRGTCPFALVHVLAEAVAAVEARGADGEKVAGQAMDFVEALRGGLVPA